MMAQQMVSALKEWKILTEALGCGEQIVLLRKGGLADAGGAFSVEHREFFLFPTYLHQKADWLNEAWRPRLPSRAEEPNVIELNLWATVTDVVRLATWEAVVALQPHTIWSRSFLEMRWSYKPGSPLLLLVVRVARLTRAHRVKLTADYAGCKSWVTLRETLAAQPADSVLSDTEFGRKRSEVLASVGS